MIALRPALPRWTETTARVYMIVLDASQSMVGERFTRAGELAIALVEQIDRRDRFSVMTCDSECRSLGDLRAPANAADDIKTWLATQTAAGATDVVASIRAAPLDAFRADPKWRDVKDGHRVRLLVAAGRAACVLSSMDDDFRAAGLEPLLDQLRAVIVELPRK